MKLYITADEIATPTGGGVVTKHEAAALLHITNPTEPFAICSPSHEQREACAGDPFQLDKVLCDLVQQAMQRHEKTPTLAHCYSGCLSQTVTYLKSLGIPVTYTAAAHDVKVSREEHEALGFAYDYPHLNDPKLWQEYLKGYLLADRVIVPSRHSFQVMKEFGVEEGKLRIIPHGVHIPREEIAPYPAMFTVGYLGAIGPDKGLKYLLQAWKELNYKDALLILAGRDSTHPVVDHWIRKFGGGAIFQAGWQDKVSSFYNNISLYIQPSASEGFGIEVLEAMAHGRPVLCSTGAGACDVVPHQFCFKARDMKVIVDRFRLFRGGTTEKPFPLEENAKVWRERARLFTWEIIHKMYQTVWSELLGR